MSTHEQHTPTCTNTLYLIKTKLPCHSWSWGPFTCLDAFPLLSVQSIMKMSIKSISGVMSAVLLPWKVLALQLFSCCMLFHCVRHYVLFRVVTVITKPSSGFSIICLQILGFHCLEEGICELDNGPHKSCTGNMTKVLFLSSIVQCEYIIIESERIVLCSDCSNPGPVQANINSNWGSCGFKLWMTQKWAEAVLKRL